MAERSPRSHVAVNCSANLVTGTSQRARASDPFVELTSRSHDDGLRSLCNAVKRAGVGVAAHATVERGDLLLRAARDVVGDDPEVVARRILSL